MPMKMAYLQNYMFEKWSGRWDSNPRHLAWEAIAPPLVTPDRIVDYSKDGGYIGLHTSGRSNCCNH